MKKTFLFLAMVLASTTQAELIKKFNFSQQSTFELFKDNNPSAHSGAKIVDDALEIYPIKHPQARDGWFSDGEGSLFYIELSGDFMIETEATVFRLDGTTGLPTAEFTSAGLMIKKPNEELGQASWLMYNIGFQRGYWAREFKVTRPSIDPEMIMPYWETLSLSTLKLIPAERLAGFTKLRLARIDGEYRAFYQDSSGDWVQETPEQVKETSGFGTEIPIKGFNDEELTPKNFGLGDKVHVGIITNSGTRAPKSDGGGRFKSFSVYSIKKFDDALRP